MLNLMNTTSSQTSIEAVVRNAITLGELSPGAEAFISQACAEKRITAQEKQALEILQDAIANNCIKRISF